MTGKFKVSIVVYELLENWNLVQASQVNVKDVFYLVIRLFIIFFAFFREVLSRSTVGI